MREVGGDGWRISLPDDLIARPQAAFGYESGVIARGWLGEAPVTVTVQRRSLGPGFNDWVRQFTRAWLEHEPPRRIDVVNAKDAVRVDGVIEFDGLGAKDDRERCTAVLAKRGRAGFVVTIRSRPEDGIEAELEPIATSFELVV